MPITPIRSRRAAAVLATLALGVSLVGVAPADAATHDGRPATQGGSWLAAQLTHGVVHNAQFSFDDYGLSVDVALGLSAADRQPKAVTSIVNAVGAHLDSYVSYPSGTGTHVSAGSLAKAAVLAQATGRNPRAYGGRNLIADLEQRVATSAPIVGRVQDQLGTGDTDPTTDGDQADADYANVLGQAYATQALARAGSARATLARQFLLTQQCPAGYFRLYFAADPTTAGQSCAAGRSSGSSPADTDVTSVAVLALLPQRKNHQVGDAVAQAGRWLAAHQHKDGSFGGGTSTKGANANSTGLAAWALGAIGRTTAAGRAATWVRAHQVHEAGTCTSKLRSAKGAIGYDSATLALGRKKGITKTTADQWRRASAQALPALRYAKRAASKLRITTRKGAHKAGHKIVLTISGVAPGDSICLTGRGTKVTRTAAQNGSVRRVQKLPAGSATRTYKVVDSAGRKASVRVRVVR